MTAEETDSEPTTRTRSVSTDHPKEVRFRCDCGWEGLESDLGGWDVQTDRDRVVRICPGCRDAVPEWGTFQPIDAVSRLARGDLRDALRQADTLEE